MHCLQISGFQRTGKNIAIIGLGNWLVGRGYELEPMSRIPPRGSRDNFRAVIKHPTLQKRVLLNTASDFEINADQLLQFYLSHEPIDVLITSIRDAGPERAAMENAIQQLRPIQTIEMPLAKISRRRRDDFDAALNNYEMRVELLCQFVLRGLPFQL